MRDQDAAHECEHDDTGDDPCGTARTRRSPAGCELGLAFVDGTADRGESVFVIVLERRVVVVVEVAGIVLAFEIGQRAPQEPLLLLERRERIGIQDHACARLRHR